MKSLAKNFVNPVWLTLPLFLGLLLFTAGCITRPGRNPLETWTGGLTASEGRPFGTAINYDYQNYVRNLPADEKSRIDDSNVRFYEDAAGQRAVEITVPINRIRWKHVLFYDQAGKRIKAIKYAASRYVS